MFYFNQKTDDKFTRGLIEILKMINQDKVNTEIAQTILKLKNNIQFDTVLMMLLLKSKQVNISEFDKLYAQYLLQKQNIQELQAPLMCAVQNVKNLCVEKKHFSVTEFSMLIQTIQQLNQQIKNQQIDMLLVECLNIKSMETP